jgi:hypothetical protein
LRFWELGRYHDQGFDHWASAGRRPATARAIARGETAHGGHRSSGDPFSDKFLYKLIQIVRASTFLEQTVEGAERRGRFAFRLSAGDRHLYVTPQCRYELHNDAIFTTNKIAVRSISLPVPCHLLWQGK